MKAPLAVVIYAVGEALWLIADQLRVVFGRPKEETSTLLHFSGGIVPVESVLEGMVMVQAVEALGGGARLVRQA